MYQLFGLWGTAKRGFSLQKYLQNFGMDLEEIPDYGVQTVSLFLHLSHPFPVESFVCVAEK